ncbi:MAG TPA: tryptophan synthase subunit alpha [Actinokineospora sp.]|nr:tryptophan synthase subunit alpha [Actinokineospora sp.]
MSSVVSLEASLRTLRASGRKLLVPYVTAGVDPTWLDYVHAAVDAGADAVEIGIPFSDPVIDGPVIQAASVRALARGTTPDSVFADLAGYRGSAPLIVMTYYNLVQSAGLDRFAADLVNAGVSATILPDLSMEEGDDWAAAASSAGVENVLIAAPSSSDSRLSRICARSSGFVYGMGVMGVTGERAGLSDSACEIANRLTAVTDKPVLIGVGVSTPANAERIVAHADGVAIGAPVVRTILADGGTGGVADLVRGFRTELDRAAVPA